MLTKGWYRAVSGYFAIYKRAGCEKLHRSGRRIDLDIPGLWVMYEIVNCADLAASDPGFRQQIRGSAPSFFNNVHRKPACPRPKIAQII